MNKSVPEKIYRTGDIAFLNEKGEFISAEEGQRILDLAANDAFEYAGIENIGRITTGGDYAERHLAKILSLDLVEAGTIGGAGLKVVVDCVNSVGGIVLPKLLRKLGVKEVIELYCEPTGMFPHNPEPLPEHLADLAFDLRTGVLIQVAGTDDLHLDGLCLNGFERTLIVIHGESGQALQELLNAGLLELRPSGLAHQAPAQRRRQ